MRKNGAHSTFSTKRSGKKGQLKGENKWGRSLGTSNSGTWIGGMSLEGSDMLSLNSICSSRSGLEDAKGGLLYWRSMRYSEPSLPLYARECESAESRPCSSSPSSQ